MTFQRFTNISENHSDHPPFYAENEARKPKLYDRIDVKRLKKTVSFRLINPFNLKTILKSTSNKDFRKIMLKL